MTTPRRQRARRAASLFAAALTSLPVGLTVLPSGTAAAAPVDCATAGITVSSLNPPVFYTDIDPTPKLVSGYAGYSVTSSAARKDLWVRVGNFTGGSLGLASGQPGSLPLGDLGAGATVPSFFMLTASGLSSSAQMHTVEVYAGNPNSGGSALCATSGGFSRVEDTIAAAANKVEDIDADGAAVSLSTTEPRLGGTITVRVEGNTGSIGAGPASDPNGLYMTPSALADFPAGAFRLTGTSLHIRPNDETGTARTFTNLLRLGALGGDARDYVATYTFTVTGTTASNTQLYPIQQIASGTQIKHTNTSNFGAAIPAIPAATNPLTVAMSVSPRALPAGGGTATVTQTLRSTADTESRVDQLVAELPTGAAYVPGSATLNGVTVADPAVTGSVLGFAGPVVTRASAPAVLRFDVTSPTAAGSYTTRGYGLLAGTTIDTTAGTTDAQPAPAVMSVGMTVPQVVTFPPLADTRLDGTPPALDATTDAEQPVSYSGSTPEVCTVSDGRLTLLAPGVCTVTADADAAPGYEAATPVTRSFTVLPLEAEVELLPQLITFPALPDTAWNALAPVPAASSDARLPVAYTSSTPDVCTVSDGVLGLRAPGTCAVSAANPGDDRYGPASATTSFVVTRAEQRIDIAAPLDTALTAPAPDVQATATSGLPVLLSAGPARVCSLSEGSLTLQAVGTCVIDAAQPGDDRWSAAAPVRRSFEVQAVGQTITFPVLADVLLDEPAPALAASADSGLPVGYSSTTPTVCTVTDNRLSLVGPGQCTVTATQPGDGKYAPAVPVERSFQAGLVGQSIAFPALPDAVLGRAAPVPGAQSSARLPISYSTTTPAVCTISGGTVTLIGTGVCTLVAAAPGNGTHAAAPAVSRSFTVQAPPPLTVVPSGTSTTGTAPGAVTLSGLPAGATLTVAADAVGSVPGVARVQVTGTKVTVTATPTFSGVITLPVTVHADGRSVPTTVRVVVVPNPAVAPASRFADATSTGIAWQPAPNARGYEVRLGGRVVCVVTRTSCTVPGLLGPKADLRVTALGGAGTRSAVSRPVYRSAGLVRVASVYFASDSSALSPLARQTLDKVAATMRSQGFSRLQLVGNTDSRASYLYNLGLSRARAQTVEAYVRQRLTGTGVKLAVDYRSETRPAAPNTTAAGRALNRRTDVSLG